MPTKVVEGRQKVGGGIVRISLVKTPRLRRVVQLPRTLPVATSPAGGGRPHEAAHILEHDLVGVPGQGEGWLGLGLESGQGWG